MGPVDGGRRRVSSMGLVDGAARVYDPIVLGELGEDQYGVFLKDFKPHAW